MFNRLNRETLVAIIIGFIIGLILTYGIIRANRSIKTQKQTVSPIPSEEITSPNQFETPVKSSLSDKPNLAIIQPESYTLTEQNTQIITGTTLPFNAVIILYEKSSQALIADEVGKFETEINLSPGINYLSIYAINNDGSYQSKTIYVTYSQQQ